MTAKNKKKGKQKPPKIKVDLNAGMPKPKPVEWADPTQLLEGVSNNELLGCWVWDEWEEQGMTPVIVARRQEADRVIYASFLVDFYCLGVKDAYWRSGISEKAFQRSLPELCFGEPEPCDPGFAHELIYGSIEFARKYGFEPHRDFEKARLGYHCVRLDSARFIVDAHRLYRSFGFCDIEPYPGSEIPPDYQCNWVFMEKQLDPAS